MSHGDKHYTYRALDRRVLVVAVETEGMDWAAYIDAVDGISHEKEYMSVAQTGTKVTEKMGTMLFPRLAEKLPWRD